MKSIVETSNTLNNIFLTIPVEKGINLFLRKFHLSYKLKATHNFKKNKAIENQSCKGKHVSFLFFIGGGFQLRVYQSFKGLFPKHI